MPEEPEVFKKLAEAEATPDLFVPFTGSYEMNQQIIEHKTWLKTIRHEKPSPKCHYRVGIYIRYFNQTKHDNYLEYHIRQYQDTMALYPNWDLVGFYIDEGATAPNMESAKEWCRLLSDCFSGKIENMGLAPMRRDNRDRKGKVRTAIPEVLSPSCHFSINFGRSSA